MMETDLPAGLWKIIPPEHNAGHRGDNRGTVVAPVYEEQASHDPIQQPALMCILWLTRHLEEAGGDPYVVGNAALIAATGLPADAVHLELRVVLLLCQGLCQEAPVEAPDGGGHLHGTALKHGAAQGDAVPRALPHILEGWLHHGGDWRPNTATDRDAIREQLPHPAWSPRPPLTRQVPMISKGLKPGSNHTKSNSCLTFTSDWAGATFYLSPTYEVGITFSKHSSHTEHCLEELPSSALSCEKCNTSSCITAWIQSSDLIRMTGPII